MVLNSVNSQISKVKELTKQYYDVLSNIKRFDAQKKALRIAIGGLMSELNLRALETDVGKLNYSVPKSFDQGMLKLEEPDLYKQFITIHIIPEHEEEHFNKESFKELHPEKFEQYKLDLPARLFIK